jgi:NDP-sugar pyrophosphorylase family protein
VSALSTKDIYAVLLVGGMGTRLRSVVSNGPKALATVGNKSFLELLIRQLCDQEIRHLVMCTGYLADQIENQLGDGRNWGVSIQYSKELQPLGTAGAVKLAEPFLQDADEFLVMNGDSFMEVDFHQLLQFHRKNNAEVTMAVRQVENASRFGTVRMDSAGRVSGFLEKTGVESPGVVNAGVYVFGQEVLKQIPQGPCSLEKDVFPKLLKRGIHALEQHGLFIDIGTPEDYARAQLIYHRLYQAASLKQ